MRRTWPLLFALVFLPRAAGAQGNPVGPEFRVNTTPAGDQFNASVAADSSGGFVVVWTWLNTGGNDDVFAQRYDDSGLPLGPQFRVNTSTIGDQFNASVASGPSGNFVVVWSSIEIDQYSDIYAQRFDGSGAPAGPEFRVNTTTTNIQAGASVAFASTGDFVVVWTSFLGGVGNGDIYGQRYSGSGVPLGPEFRVNTFTYFRQRDPDVAADSAGNFVVVWSSEYQVSPVGPCVYGQRYASSGIPLGPEFRVNTFTSVDSSQGGVSVAVRPSGDFVAVWGSVQQDDPDGDIYGQRFSASGAPAGPEFRVNTFMVGTQKAADVSLDASGNFVVVWSSEAQEDGLGIFAQRYDASGALLGSEFRANTYTSSDQGWPSVAADTLGNFVVTWESFGQDGFGSGVFGQRYAPIFPVELIHLTVE